MPAQTKIRDLTDEQLRQLYEDCARSMSAMARRLGVGEDAVRRALQRRLPSTYDAHIHTGRKEREQFSKRPLPTAVRAIDFEENDKKARDRGYF